MHSVLWASIFASAGVALVTTLLVEYFAKPGLEARKDRILESSRERRTAIKQIRQVYFLVADIYAHRPENEVLRQRAHKIALDIERLMDGVFQVINVPQPVETRLA